MNTAKTTPILVLCFLGLMVFPACLEVETTSQINSDGSILRTVTFDDDSAAIYRGHFPVPFDSTWGQSIRKIDANKFRLTVTKLFPDVDEMNVALKGTYGKTLQFQFTFERNFQWFFTSYRYTETNLKYLQIDTIPLTDYLSREEIEGWRLHEVEKQPFVTKGDSLALSSAGPRFEEWERRNLFEATFAEFLKGVRSLNSPKLTTTLVLQSKDTLFKCSAKALKESNIDTMSIIFARILRNQLVYKAWDMSAQGLKQVSDKMNVRFDGSFVTNAVMPGLITGSNAQTIEGNKATWRDYKDYAKVLGYTMWIESKQVNWWAVIVTGVIVALIAILLVLSTLRRRRLG